MSIHLLEDEVINQIAAGEVIERPASVVKELLENALDAGSTHITVHLNGGAKSLIKVSDDGGGISRDELWLALRRHATSKIRKSADIFEISTLGFRGEALASIASVSNLTLRSRRRGAPEGFFLKGAKAERGFEEIWPHASEGTQVEVADLFKNTPVREKFLKNDSSEISLCLELISHLALSHSGCGISVFVDDRIKLQTKAVEIDKALLISGDKAEFKKWKEKIREIFPNESIDDLYPVFGRGTYGAVYGLASAPGVERATAKSLRTFVNSRFVVDKVLKSGIQRGYYSHIPRGRYPVAFIFYECDPGLLDVNVHPRKAEVRFQYPAEVGGEIGAAIREMLRQAEWALSDLSVAENLGVFSLKNRSVESRGFAETDPSPKATHVTAGGFPSASKGPSFVDESFSAHNRNVREVAEGVPPSPPAIPIFGDYREPLGPIETFIKTQRAPEAPLAPKAQTDIIWGDLEYKTSIFGCYLIFTYQGDNLLLLDQHAFHERILYEKLKQNAKDYCTKERSLFPEVLGLDRNEMSVLKKAEPYWSKLGFEMSFDEERGLCEVSAVPSIAKNANLDDLMRKIVAHESAEVVNEDVLYHDILASLACHSAVRSGDILEPAGVMSLIAEASGIDFFHNCPHGRRVLRIIPRKDIAHLFDRP